MHATIIARIEANVNLFEVQIGVFDRRLFCFKVRRAAKRLTYGAK